jgi:integrase
VEVSDRKLGGELHKLPIPKRLLWSLQERAEFAKDERMFPGQGKNKFITSNALDKTLDSFSRTDVKGDRITIHGFRSTFTDWVMATSAGLREDTDRQLGHREKDQTLAAYWRVDLFARRAKLIQQYEDFALSEIDF